MGHSQIVRPISILLTIPFLLLPMDAMIFMVVGFGLAHYLLSFYYGKQTFNQNQFFAKFICLFVCLAAFLFFERWGPALMGTLFGLHWAMSEAFLDNSDKNELYPLVRFVYYFCIYQGISWAMDGLFFNLINLAFTLFLLVVILNFNIRSKNYMRSMQDLLFQVAFAVLLFSGKVNYPFLFPLILLHTIEWIVHPVVKFKATNNSSGLKSFLLLNLSLSIFFLVAAHWWGSDSKQNYDRMMFEFFRIGAVHILFTLLASEMNFSWFKKFRIAH